MAYFRSSSRRNIYPPYLNSGIMTIPYGILNAMHPARLNSYVRLNEISGTPSSSKPHTRSNSPTSFRHIELSNAGSETPEFLTPPSSPRAVLPDTLVPGTPETRQSTTKQKAKAKATDKSEKSKVTKQLAEDRAKAKRVAAETARQLAVEADDERQRKRSESFRNDTIDTRNDTTNARDDVEQESLLRAASHNAERDAAAAASRDNAAAAAASESRRRATLKATADAAARVAFKEPPRKAPSSYSDALRPDKSTSDSHYHDTSSTDAPDAMCCIIIHSARHNALYMTRVSGVDNSSGTASVTTSYHLPCISINDYDTEGGKYANTDARTMRRAATRWCYEHNEQQVTGEMTDHPMCTPLFNCNVFDYPIDGEIVPHCYVFINCMDTTEDHLVDSAGRVGTDTQHFLFMNQPSMYNKYDGGTLRLTQPYHDSDQMGIISSRKLSAQGTTTFAGAQASQSQTPRSIQPQHRNNKMIGRPASFYGLSHPKHADKPGEIPFNFEDWEKHMLLFVGSTYLDTPTPMDIKEGYNFVCSVLLGEANMYQSDFEKLHPFTQSHTAHNLLSFVKSQCVKTSKYLTENEKLKELRIDTPATPDAWVKFTALFSSHSSRGGIDDDHVLRTHMLSSLSRTLLGELSDHVDTPITYSYPHPVLKDNSGPYTLAHMKKTLLEIILKNHNKFIQLQDHKRQQGDGKWQQVPTGKRGNEQQATTPRKKGKGDKGKGGGKGGKGKPSSTVHYFTRDQRVNVKVGRNGPFADGTAKTCNNCNSPDHLALSCPKAGGKPGGKGGGKGGAKGGAADVHAFMPTKKEKALILSQRAARQTGNMNLSLNSMSPDQLAQIHAATASGSQDFQRPVGPSPKPPVGNHNLFAAMMGKKVD